MAEGTSWGEGIMCRGSDSQEDIREQDIVFFEPERTLALYRGGQYGGVP